MSYDLELCCPVSGEVLRGEQKHAMRGGTYCLGGTDRLELNVTWNYAPHYYRHLCPAKGIRALYGLTGAQAAPLLATAAAALGDTVHEDYWQPTEGNAKRALLALRAMSLLRPDGVWRGD